MDNNIHLIMLSAGADDGVKKGYCFTVYRGDKYIGKVEVERTFGDMSSARIINPLSAPAGIVREGDSASTGVY